MPKKIVLLASGNGTNAANICRFFHKDNKVDIISVFTNNPYARVIERVEEYGIKAEVFDKISFNKGDLLKTICSLNPDLIVLAGFLLKLGPDWIRAFPDKILNIHPALLPKYGGKGMFGNYVHQAVKNNKEKETGITIHYVNEDFDKGKILFQKKVKIDLDDTIEEIAFKIHQLEYVYFPKIIKKFLTNQVNEG